MGVGPRIGNEEAGRLLVRGRDARATSEAIRLTSHWGHTSDLREVRRRVDRLARLLRFLASLTAAIAQLVRALDCDSRGRGFESRWPPHFLDIPEVFSFESRFLRNELRLEMTKAG